MDLSHLNAAELDKLEAALSTALDGRKFESFVPYPKQWSFFDAGAEHRERLLCAANRVGKTMAASYEVAAHLTGRYPAVWMGKRFDRPPVGIAAGVTSQLVRDSTQQLLLGTPQGILGTGFIPADDIVDVSSARGVAGAADLVKVKWHNEKGEHKGESTLYFRAYEQGRERIQALTADMCWLDEEPPLDYYMEALTRTNVAFGPVFLTFTPLLGMSDVVKRFLQEKSEDRHVTTMTINDVEHYTPEQRAKIIASYPPHERDARIKGIPMLGSGKIFPIDRESITVDAFPLPDHWPRLCGMDFGWAHATAAVWGAWDRDTDTIYIYDLLKMKETLIPVIAAAIRGRGDWIPVAWPHDGMQVRDGNSGDQLAQQYRNEGVNMRSEHAHFAETPSLNETKMSRISTEAGIQEMLTRMMAGRFKVFRHLNDWFEEFDLYHRKDGLIVKVDDDAMSATRILTYDLRHSALPPSQLFKAVDHERRSEWYA